MTQPEQSESVGSARAPACPAPMAPGSDRRYDLLAPGVLDDPYPLYDEMRASDPVYRDRRFFGWILTRYDDVATVLRDLRVSSVRPLAAEPVSRSLASIADEVRELREFQSRWMLYLDPP